jgi:CrcB protein
MGKVLLVGLGGFIGSICRYLLSGVAQSLFPSSTFPIGTMIVNISGCLVIGVLSQLADSRNAFSDLTRLLVFVGILGGYTTFSSFGNESINLLRSGDYLLASANIVGQVVVGLLFVLLGRVVGQAVWR